MLKKPLVEDFRFVPWQITGLHARRGELPRCGAFDGRVHVWDAAAREWLLPRIVALSASKAASNTIRAMMKRMLEPDPSKRPTFPELLEELT